MAVSGGRKVDHPSFEIYLLSMSQKGKRLVAAASDAHPSGERLPATCSCNPSLPHLTDETARQPRADGAAGGDVAGPRAPGKAPIQWRKEVRQAQRAAAALIPAPLPTAGGPAEPSQHSGHTAMQGKELRADGAPRSDGAGPRAPGNPPLPRRKRARQAQRAAAGPIPAPRTRQPLRMRLHLVGHRGSESFCLLSRYSTIISPDTSFKLQDGRAPVQLVVQLAVHPFCLSGRRARGRGCRAAAAPWKRCQSMCSLMRRAPAVAPTRLCARVQSHVRLIVSHLCLICVSACDYMRGGGSREARCAAPCKRCQSKCSLMRRAPAIAPTRFCARVHFKHTHPLRLICVSPLQHLAAPLQHPCSTPEGWRATCRGTRSTLFNRCGSTSATVWSV